ncbi:MAG: cadherin repeat domain-containing protein, partial [Rubripirellula sp.]
VDDRIRNSLIEQLNTIDVTNADIALMTKPGLMWSQLDDHRSQMELQIQGDLIVVGAAGAAASSFTIGAVAWAMRTGFLASGLLAQLPAWTAMDPLLIMQGMGDSEDDESLEEMMERQSEALDK